MKAKRNRVLSILLAAAMVITLLPETSVTAFAVGTTYPAEAEREGETEESAEEAPEITVEEPAEEAPDITVEEPAEEEPEITVEEPAEEKPEITVEEPGEEKPEITVEEPAEEKPEITVEEPGDEGTEIPEEETPADNEGLADESVLEEEATEQQYSFGIGYTSSYVDVSINVNGKEYMSAKQVAKYFSEYDEDPYYNGDGYGGADFSLPAGTYTIVVHPKDNCSFDYAMTCKQGADEYDEVNNINGTQFTVKVPDIESVYIRSSCNYLTTLSVKGGAALSSTGNSHQYNVDVGKTYTVKTRKGVSGTVSYTDMYIVYYETGKSDYNKRAKSTAKYSSTTGELTIDAADAGRTLRAVLYEYGPYWDDDKDDYVVGDHWVDWVDLQVAAGESLSYETKLTLKKGVTTLYTGQQDAVAATIQYRQTTTCREIAKVEVTDKSGNAVKGVTARMSDDGTQVLVSVNNSYVTPDGAQGYNKAAPGKYTLKVTAKAGAGMTPATASLTITVVQSIEEIKVSAASRIFQDSGKAASLKITPVFNGGSKSLQPKQKKVAYAVVDAVTHEVLPETNGVKVSNGTVKVDKNCALAGTGKKFEVRAQATDYAGSVIEGYSDPIEITSAKLCIVKKTPNSTGTYTVVAVAGAKVTPKTLADTKVLVLTGNHSDISKDTVLKENDERIIPAAEVTFQSGNKILKIDANGNITVDDKTAKKVSIKATINEGGKKKTVPMNIEIGYASAAVYGLQAVDADSGKEISSQYESKTITCSGTNTATLQMNIMTKANAADGWTKASDDVYDVKLTVGKNAKIIDKSKAALGIYTIRVNQGEATVSLTYKNAAGKKIKENYTIKN